MQFAQRRQRLLRHLFMSFGCGLVLSNSAPALAVSIRAVSDEALCLVAAGGSQANGTPVVLAKCDASNNQSWTLSDNAIKTFANKCLDVPHANTAAGTKLQIWDCNGRANQAFHISKQTLVWAPAKMCVDIPSNNPVDGVRLQTWSCNDGAAQNWHVGDLDLSARPTTDGKWKLVWSDEFGGASLDATKWRTEVNCDGGGNNEAECYVDSPNNLSVHDGLLFIRALKQDFRGKAYTSGRINTSGKAHWTYGRFETRIKVPCGQGLWPAAWMLPEPNSYGTWPTSGELDVMEILGGNPNVLYGTAHFGRPWPNQAQKGGTAKLSNGSYCGDFHVYALEWSPTQATWFVDGNAYFTLTPTDGDWTPLTRWPFDKPFYFILNLAVGGSWPGAPDPSIREATMQVDYVRAFERL